MLDSQTNPFSILWIKHHSTDRQGHVTLILFILFQPLSKFLAFRLVRLANLQQGMPYNCYVLTRRTPVLHDDISATSASRHLGNFSVVRAWMSKVNARWIGFDVILPFFWWWLVSCASNVFCQRKNPKQSQSMSYWLHHLVNTQFSATRMLK